MISKQLIKLIFQPEIIKDAIKVSLVVGSLLNTINQGNAIFNFDIEEISFFKLILTYIVPYLVSVYSSVKTSLRNSD